MRRLALPLITPSNFVSHEPLPLKRHAVASRRRGGRRCRFRDMQSHDLAATLLEGASIFALIFYISLARAEVERTLPPEARSPARRRPFLDAVAAITFPARRMTTIEYRLPD